jgi:predicted acyl esterase
MCPQLPKLKARDLGAHEASSRLAVHFAMRRASTRCDVPPSDISDAALESTIEPNSFADQRMIFARLGKQLVYHSAPFEADTEVAGFCKLSAWLAIDQAGTDFAVWMYEIRQDGGSILLSGDPLRARYREMHVPQNSSRLGHRCATTSITSRSSRNS